MTMGLSAAHTDDPGISLSAPQQGAFGVALHFLRDETIFAEGDKASQVLRIEHGTVRLCRHFASGRRAIIHFAFPGDLIGLTQAPAHFLTAEAVTRVRATAFGRQDIERLMRADAAIREHMLAHLSQSLLATENLVAALGSRNTNGRLASFLLGLASRMSVAQGGVLELAMSRRDIADHLGLSIESVCRGIAALKTRGAVTLPDAHRIVLRDMRLLTLLADGGAAEAV
jgi:CRP-like cAMP-binding protein